MILSKLPTYRFNIEKSIFYNSISHDKILVNFSYNNIRKNVHLLGYQSSDAIGHPKDGGRDYVVLFEFTDEPGEEYWFHVSKAFFLLNNINI